MSERPIRFNGEMVRATLDGTKTQTRLVIKPQPDAVYRLTGDTAPVILYARKETDYAVQQWREAGADPRVAELGLSGGSGWADLLADEIQGLWEKGLRGVVCATWAPKRQGLFDCFVVPPQRQSHEVGPPVSMYGVSRDADQTVSASEASGREAGEQQPNQLMLGNPEGKLDGQASTWTRHGRREAPVREVHEHREVSYPLGCSEGVVQPATRRPDARRSTTLNWKNSPFSIGLTLWVRESLVIDSEGVYYAADMHSVAEAVLEANADWIAKHWPESKRSCPSIYMPRWACRLLPVVGSVRVERLQNIDWEGVLAEGTPNARPPQGIPMLDDFTGWTDAQCAFQDWWDSINAKRASGWTMNPWVWVGTFSRIEEPKDE